MGVSAKEVNELRKQTGAGLMDCKKALTEANGNVEEAIDLLRKKGQKVSALRAGRDANEGAAIAITNSDCTKGLALHLSCETDFVARNSDFVDFAQQLAQLALDNNIGDTTALLASSIEGTTVEAKIAEKVGAIGENIQIAGLELLEGTGIIAYIHAGNKIGVLAQLNQAVNDANATIGRDVAMQIAAMKPIAVDEAGVSQEVKDRELTIGKEQAVAEGKPENIIEKIAEGKLKRFYKDNTLLHQQFVKDSSQTVAQALQATEKGLTVEKFVRLALGDN